MRYGNLGGVPRRVIAEEGLIVTASVTHPTDIFVNACLVCEGRVEGGPIRIKFLSPPTNMDGKPLFSADVWEWSLQEIQAILTTGGFILGASAQGNATLWITYYA